MGLTWTSKVSLLMIWWVWLLVSCSDFSDSNRDLMTSWQLLQTRQALSSKLRICFWPEHLAHVTIPQARQLYFFRIILKGCEHSMHLWMASNLSKWGCFLPISESMGRKISRPMRNDDLRWYNSLMASNRDSNQSSFSLRVLQKIKKCYQLFKKKNRQKRTVCTIPRIYDHLWCKMYWLWPDYLPRGFAYCPHEIWHVIGRLGRPH